MHTVKIGSVELTEQKAREICESDRHYLITYSKIYEARTTKNGGFRGSLILDHQPGMARRGCFYLLNAAEVNQLIGWKLLNE